MKIITLEITQLLPQLLYQDYKQITDITNICREQTIFPES